VSPPSQVFETNACWPSEHLADPLIRVRTRPASASLKLTELADLVTVVILSAFVPTLVVRTRDARFGNRAREGAAAGPKPHWCKAPGVRHRMTTRSAAKQPDALDLCASVSLTTSA